MPAGLYLVTLLNDEPIPVNAHDHRIADRCIRVNRLNCKVGVTRDLVRRRRDYERTFGAEYVTFQPYAVVDEDIAEDAERIVLQQVHEYRVRGRTGRLNEWLVGIEPQQALHLALYALNASELEYELWNDIE